MSQDVERWKADLTAAGWTAASATAWWDPTGGLYRGPYGAWKELQRRKAEIVSEDKDKAPERTVISKSVVKRLEAQGAPDSKVSKGSGELHEQVTRLLEGTHCPKHGMEWEACCISEVILELHWKVKDLVTTKVREASEEAFKESAESIVNEAGKVGQLMDLASASARREERTAIKETVKDYFTHFPCTCVGQSRTGGHFACCPITIRDEVLGRIAALERAADSREGESPNHRI